MQIAMLLVGVVAVVTAWVWAALRLVAWQAARSRRRGAGAGAPDGRVALPKGHLPPPGLTPLSPSERFLNQEAARGMDALQRYLAEQRRV